jgi:hypothetical protein
MSTNIKIEAKRQELRELKQREEALRQELRDLFTQHAVESCPISVGTKVEYDDGKYGQVDRIGFHVEWNDLDPNKVVDWTVSGRKFNKDGQFGKKNFQPIGPATHFVIGTQFKFKGIAGIFGVQDDDA